MSRFDIALEIVLKHEGGVSNHKNDRGGLTFRGITQKVYDDYRKSIGKPQRPVTEIDDSELKEVYFQYWKRGSCDYLPKPLDVIHFDSCVNHGHLNANKILQRTLGVGEDGIIGKQTLSALHEDIAAIGIEEVCLAYLRERKAFYENIVKNRPSQKVFARGWANRIDSLRALV